MVSTMTLQPLPPDSPAWLERRPSNMNKETPIMRDIRVALVKTGRVMWWRNNRGVAKYGEARVPYGLGAGSADLVGQCKIVSLPGCTRFFAVEVKTPDGELEDDQILWINAVNRFGGYACVCESVTEALAHLERASNCEPGPEV
jgi:hypothetical protein